VRTKQGKGKEKSKRGVGSGVEEGKGAKFAQREKERLEDKMS
jgi:hypothetical protein